MRNDKKLNILFLVFFLNIVEGTYQCGNYGLTTRYIGRYLADFSTFYLEDSDQSGYVQVVNFSSSQPSKNWLPVAGDWNSTGFDSVGLFDPLTMNFHLKYNTSMGNGADFSFQYKPVSSGVILKIISPF